MVRIRFWSILLALALLPLFGAQPARAMVYTIAPGPDLILNNGVCSLREALLNANYNNQVGSPDCPAGQDNVTDTIVLQAGQSYPLTIATGSSSDSNAAENDLDVLNNLIPLDLQIISNGAERATIQFEVPNAQSSRVLEVQTGATVLLLRVKIAGGDGGLNGGGIQNNGTLTLENSEVVDNFMGSGGQNGGGIYTGPGSNLTLRAGSVVRDNVSLGGGGGIYNDGGTVTIENSSIVDNQSYREGGGVGGAGSGNNAATLAVMESVISGNKTSTVDGDGGGVWNGNASTTTIGQNSVLEQNTARRHGGAIAGLNGGTVNISASTLRDNRSGTNVNAEVTAAGNGGAVWNSGDLFVTSSAVHDNAAGKGANSHGGAFYNTGLLVLSNSAVYANQTQPGSAGGGGAIYNSKTLVVLNSTISGNTADGRGGAIRMSGGYADIRHATIAGNTATVAHGGLYLVGPTPKVDIKHTILAGNTAADCSNDFATVTSKGYNLVGDACGGAFSAATNDLVGVDPKLAALADNDGATKTRAPLLGSPALNAIPKAACADNDWPQLATDQRGVARPQGAACEIGAYEQKALDIVNPNPLPTLASLAPNSAPVGSGDFVLVVAGTNFVQGAVVRWNGSDRLTTFVSAAELKAGITQADLAVAGTAQVTVFNPGPGGGSSNALTFVIAAPDKQSQTITFAPIADRTLLEDSFALSATASSGLPATYSASGVCAVVAGTVTLLGAGICTITAGQAGNETFNAAPDVVRLFKVSGQRLFLPLISRSS